MTTPAVPSWSPSGGELDDLETLLLGGYPPLRGFLGAADVAAVRATGALVDGRPWPVPVTLVVPAPVAERALAAGRLELLDEEGTPIAEMEVTEVAPGERGAAVAGPVVARRPLERGPYPELRRPAAAGLPTGTRPRLGVPVRDAPHHPTVAAVAAAAAALDAEVLLLPLVGQGSPRGLTTDGLVRATAAAAELLRAGGTTVHLVPVAVPRHHGASAAAEEQLAAHVAQAYGATHVPGPLPGAVDVIAVELPEVVQDTRDGHWAPASIVPGEWRGPLAAADVPGVVDRAVAEGSAVAAGLTTDAAVRELRRRRPGGREGITVLFTGLSGSGKSTLAKAVHAAVLERTDRAVSMLDGDVVRRMLSAGLTFSRADRELNVRRIGYVAAEVTRHGGLALCAPIAPYAAVRAEVRAMVEEFGRFVLVHVNTPLAVCEARDRKGLYAKARRGEIPHFTGISDPYEEPTDADLALDTSVVPVAQAVEEVLAVIGKVGSRP